MHGWHGKKKVHETITEDQTQQMQQSTRRPQPRFEDPVKM